MSRITRRLRPVVSPVPKFHIVKKLELVPGLNADIALTHMETHI